MSCCSVLLLITYIRRSLITIYLAVVIVSNTVSLTCRLVPWYKPTDFRMQHTEAYASVLLQIITFIITFIYYIILYYYYEECFGMVLDRHDPGEHFVMSYHWAKLLKLRDFDDAPDKSVSLPFPSLFVKAFSFFFV